MKTVCVRAPALEPTPRAAPKPHAYENNTYIDWRSENSASRGLGYQKWATLVVMALCCGYSASLVDLLAAWLNDFKKGFCFSRSDSWLLLNPYLTCPPNDWYNWLRLVGADSLAGVLLDFPIYAFFSVLFVLAAAYVTIEHAPLNKQLGIPEIKLIIAGLNYHLSTYLGTRALVYKAAGLVLVVSLGLWLGKEGPLVHIAGCILLVVYRRMYTEPAEGLRRELLSAATATGIAVAFNSPVGGVLFVVELLPSYFVPTRIMWNSFVCATVAVVALSGFKLLTDGANFHEQVLFEVHFGSFLWLIYEMLPFFVLGVAGGFFGWAYTTVYLHFLAPHRKLRLYRLFAVAGIAERHAPYAEIAAVALVSALLTFALSLTRMPLGAFLKLLFTDCPTGENYDSNSANFMCSPLAVATLFKLLYIWLQGFFLSTYSYGLALPGGILTPLLVLGATAGRFVGIVSLAVQHAVMGDSVATCTAKTCLVSPSSYAVVGAAAFMTGITKLTLCVVVIIFELTGAVSYVLPIMIAVITSKFVSDLLCDENVYDSWLTSEFNVNGFTASTEANFDKGHGICNFANLSVATKRKLPDVTIKRVMVPLAATRHLTLFPTHPYSLSQLHGFLNDDCHEGYPLVASPEDPTSLGYVYKRDIYQQLARVVGTLQPTAALVCFTCEVPLFLATAKASYLEEVGNRYTDIYTVPVEPEPTSIIVKDNTPFKQVIELFERLHLNYLVVTEHTNNRKMCGFVDRFILSRLIHLKFADLQHDIELEFGIDDDTPLRRHRESFELIS